MKLLIDQNISRKLTVRLQTTFPGTLHVSEAGLDTSHDIEVWEYARANGYIILSKDIDFDYLSQVHGCPPKVIRLQCGNVTTGYIQALIVNSYENLIDFGNDKKICLIIIS